MEVAKVAIPMSEEMLTYLLDVLTTHYWAETFSKFSTPTDLEYQRQMLLSLDYYVKHFNQLANK
jgi:hypothetical protein